MYGCVACKYVSINLCGCVLFMYVSKRECMLKCVDKRQKSVTKTATGASLSVDGLQDLS